MTKLNQLSCSNYIGIYIKRLDGDLDLAMVLGEMHGIPADQRIHRALLAFGGLPQEFDQMYAFPNSDIGDFVDVLEWNEQAAKEGLDLCMLHEDSAA